MFIRYVFLVLSFYTPSLASSDLASAKAYLAKYQLESELKISLDRSSECYEKVSQLRDPETKMWVYIFGLSNPKKKVLTEDQCQSIKKIIEERRELEVNWHDVRNIIRVKANLCLWEQILAENEVESAKLKVEWQEWSRLRLAYMYQENLASMQFFKKCWNVFTEEQKKNILNGKFEHLIKKNKGHARKFSADKIVQKTLGKPDKVKDFHQIIEKWKGKWSDFYLRFSKAMLLSRKYEGYMDKCSKGFGIAIWNDYSNLFAEFLQLEGESVIEIVGASYTLGDEQRLKIKKSIVKMKLDMISKYSDNGRGLLVVMGDMR